MVGGDDVGAQCSIWCTSAEGEKCTFQCTFLCNHQATVKVAAAPLPGAKIILHRTTVVVFETGRLNGPLQNAPALGIKQDFFSCGARIGADIMFGKLWGAFKV